MTISIPMVDITHADANAEAAASPDNHHLPGAAAAIAAGLIAASGRPHSINEAIALWHSVHYAIDSQHGHDTLHRQNWDAHKHLDEPHI